MSETNSSGKYRRQLIVAMVDGDDAAGNVAQAEALNAKERDAVLPSEVVVLHFGAAPDGRADAGDVEQLRLALEGKRQVALPVDAQARLYLLGEGSATRRTLAGCAPEAVAALLADAGLRAIRLLSIVGDGAGRDPDRTDDAQLDPQATSFASRLHQSLQDRGIATTVNARVGAVRVLTQAGSAGSVAIESGRKLTSAHPDAEATQHHAAATKLRLRWENGRQIREWSY